MPHGCVLSGPMKQKLHSTGVHLYLFVEFSLVNNDQLVPLVVDENMLVLLQRRTVLVTF